VLHVKRGDRYFDFSGVSGLDFAEDSRSFAVLDFDSDGKPDLVLKNRLGPQIRILQNQCAEARHSIAFELRGTASNRDAIGARIRVDGQTKWLDAGSGFLSQHSKRLIFGLGEEKTAKRVQVKWPSGAEQEFHNLAAGQIIRITENSEKLEARAYAKRKMLQTRAVEADNGMRLHDTWFVEPIPLPESQRGPGLLVLNERSLSAERREQYEIFRRYLFDWRTTIQFPLALLLDQKGYAAKVYARVPSQNEVDADLRQLANGAAAALPFEGSYVGKPYRDFFKFGAAYLWSGYPEQALPYLEAVLRRTPHNPRVQVLVGQIHLQSNRVAQAEQAFHHALEDNGSYAEAWSGLGDVSESKNQSAEALGFYEKALELKPDLLYTLLNAGRSADKLGQIAQAEGFYRRAWQIDEQSAEAANGLGLALAKQNHPDQAARYFKQAITLRRDYADAINNLGVLYIKEAKINDAIAAFEYGIRMAPNDDILYLNLGRTYAQMGNRDKAKQVMRDLLDRKPESTVAQHALAELEGR
jgi:tetratricopeptide (TPR) repeat protein